MDGKHSSPLWPFAVGCLTGAVVLGWRVGNGEGTAAGSARDANSKSLTEVAAASVAPPSAGITSKPAPATSTNAEAKEDTVADTGSSVAEVLARLEAEYRQRNTPKPAADPPAAASTAAPLADEPAATETSPSPEVAAAPPVEQKLALNDAQEGTAPVVSVRIVQETPVNEAGQQRLEAELQQVATLQQVTALQQAALAQQTALVQQFALLQYLQLFSQAPNSRVAVSAPGQRRAASRRIVDTLPSSISATDNPWGFELQPLVLPR
jgi:hypothetical protein